MLLLLMLLFEEADCCTMLPSPFDLLNSNLPVVVRVVCSSQGVSAQLKKGFVTCLLGSNGAGEHMCMG